jgi:ferredoxin
VSVQVDRERCIGAGMCALAAPDLFTQDEEDGLVVPLFAEGALPEEQESPAAEAARLCPSGALQLPGG